PCLGVNCLESVSTCLQHPRCLPTLPSGVLPKADRRSRPRRLSATPLFCSQTPSDVTEFSLTTALNDQSPVAIRLLDSHSHSPRRCYCASRWPIVTSCSNPSRLEFCGGRKAVASKRLSIRPLVRSSSEGRRVVDVGRRGPHTWVRDGSTSSLARPDDCARAAPLRVRHPYADTRASRR